MSLPTIIINSFFTDCNNSAKELRSDQSRKFPLLIKPR